MGAGEIVSFNRFAARSALLATAVCGAVLFAAACGSSGEEAEPQVSQRQLEAAIEQYRSVLKEDAANLVVKTEALATQIGDGELGRAQSRYATSRVRYSHIEPLSETAFANLDLRIDAYADEVPADEFGGFHRIERAMWVDETVAGMTPVANRLVADVEELRRKVKTAPLRPAQIASGASELLGEVPVAMKARDEEPYSDCDLVDVAANVEGAEAAFNAVKPIVEAEDPELVEEIQAQFRKTYADLDEYGTLARDPEQTRAAAPGAIFVIYSEISPDTIRELAQPIEVLAGQLSQVTELVADA